MKESPFQTRQEEYWKSAVQLSRKDPRNPVIRAYVSPKIAHIRKRMDLPERPAILDVGAGNGYFSYWWDKAGDVTAVDYSDVILANNPVEKKIVADARSLPFPDNTFDIAFCHAVLHHIERRDRVQVLREMGRVSKRYVACIEPNRNNPLVSLFSIVKREEHGGLVFSNGYVRGIAESAGLRLIDSYTFGALTPNRMPFSKLLLPVFRLLERPLPFGVTNIVVAEKGALTE